MQNYRIKQDDTIIEKDGNKTENLHRNNIETEDAETQKEAIQEYQNADTVQEERAALSKRLKILEKIIYGSEIHGGGR